MVVIVVPFVGEDVHGRLGDGQAAAPFSILARYGRGVDVDMGVTAVVPEAGLEPVRIDLKSEVSDGAAPVRRVSDDIRRDLDDGNFKHVQRTGSGCLALNAGRITVLARKRRVGLRADHRNVETEGFGSDVVHRESGERMQTLKKTCSRGSRIAASAAVAMSLAVVPLALGGTPAQAATTKAACTVNPLKPVYHHTNSAGKKVIDYRIKVKCTKDRYVKIQQRFWEEDTGFDDQIGRTKTVKRHVKPSDGTVTLHSHRVLPDIEWGDEEMYHDVRFQVGSHGVWTGYTKWEASAVRSFAY